MIVFVSRYYLMMVIMFLKGYKKEQRTRGEHTSIQPQLSFSLNSLIFHLHSLPFSSIFYHETHIPTPSSSISHFHEQLGTPILGGGDEDLSLELQRGVLCSPTLSSFCLNLFLGFQGLFFQLEVCFICIYCESSRNILRPYFYLFMFDIVLH